MEYPVVHEGSSVGNCTLTEQGLYWKLECSCQILTPCVERLYCGARRIGVLEREADQLVLRKRISKASVPELPPRSGVFTLRPVRQMEPWCGEILGYRLPEGFREGDMLLFPYDPNGPCPCEPLFCFFSIACGFWRLSLDEIRRLTLT